MATGSVSGLAMQLQEYFDQLAPNWDKEITEERRECLSNVIRELGIKSGDYVLDIGTGTGILLPFLIAELGGRGKIIALDLSSQMLRHARAKEPQPIVDSVQADVIAIPLVDNCVDLAICNSAFPHFSDKTRALKEISRVLKNDGRLVICHAMSREAINQLHKSIGGVIANDLLPDEVELTKLVGQTNLEIIHLEDGPGRYLVIAEKVA